MAADAKTKAVVGKAAGAGKGDAGATVAGVLPTLPALPTVADFAAASRGPAGKGTVQLEPAEVEAARWWINGPVRALASHFGKSPVVASFVRTVEIAGPRQGQAETGPHGRQSTRRGNAVDLVVPGISSRAVVLYLASIYGRETLFAILDGNDHAHLTRSAHPNSRPGVWREVPGGNGALEPIPGVSQGGGPAPQTQTEGLSGLQLALILLVIVAAVWFILIRRR